MSRWIPSEDRVEWGRLHRSYEDVLAQNLRWRDPALELAIPLLEYPGVAQLPT
jgi:hypothetical protein